LGSLSSFRAASRPACHSLRVTSRPSLETNTRFPP
jgi:hypothetical protein